jgi:hypothetical protein
MFAYKYAQKLEIKAKAFIKISSSFYITNSIQQVQ